MAKTTGEDSTHDRSGILNLADNDESCKSLITSDDDGVRILDHLGPGAREVLPFLGRLLPNAFDFVSRELARFRAAGEQKLGDRYARFFSYLDSRRLRVWSDQ